LWEIGTATMSAPEEYHYTAYPTQALCLGHSCYCFHGMNQMNEPIFDIGIPEPEDVSEWAILSEDSDWTIALRDRKFRHPRVLLAYVDYVFANNELAKSEEEKIVIPKMPTSVALFIFDHISLREPPEDFKNEIARLRYFVEVCSRGDFF
jgi:hypothetical protein